MYAHFVIPLLAHTLLLVVPGTLLLISCGFAPVWSVCIAPLVTTGVLSVVGQLYASLSISANPVLMLAPILLLAALLWVLVGRKKTEHTMPNMPLWIPALYVTMGLALGLTFFLSRLTVEDIFLQAYDVTEALNLIRSFADSGHFSSLDTGFYLAAGEQAIDPFPGTIFYPATWHILCAIVVQMTGCSVPLAVNASLYFFVAVVYPLGMAALMQSVFPEKPGVVVSGALTCLGFVCFPWVFIIFGPIYPNLIAFTTIPSIVAVFFNLAARGHDTHERIVLALAFLASGMGLGLLHPNGIFATAIILVPYCAWRVWTETKERFGGFVAPSLAVAGLVAVFCGVWYFCFTLPAFQDIVWHVWPKYTKTFQAIVNIVTLSYTYKFWYEFAAQIPMGICVIVGTVWALYRREYRWMIGSYALACYVAFVCATREDSDLLRHIVAGFWYTDANRIAGLCVIAAVPLASMGLNWFYEQALQLVQHYNADKRPTSARRVAVVCAALFLLVNFLPEFDMPGSYYGLVINDQYNKDPAESEWEGASEIKQRALTRRFHSVHTSFGDYRVAFDKKMAVANAISPEEVSFIKQVAEVVPTGDVVLNNPMDGSFLAYGIADVRVYYRNFVDNGFDETQQSQILRQRLADYPNDPEVQQAVADSNAKYVLILSTTGSKGSFINLRGDYSEEFYGGIRNVSEDNPGFELLLSEDDMRLYRIVR